ncbi:MAG: hypothetical protein WEA24_09565 [Gemmatimonadota bacterium]
MRMQFMAPLTAALLTLSACGAGDNASSSAQVSAYDSAGIRIVETAAPAWSEPGQGWRLAAEPTLQIGVVSGEPEYQFDRIMGTVRFDDGTIAVGTMGSGSIRYYDAEGNFLHEAGRSGEGPGEFRQLMGIGHMAGDTLFADNSHEGILLFDLSGEYLGAITAGRTIIEEGFVWPAGWLADGTAVGLTTPQGPPEGSVGQVVDSANVVIFDGEEYGPVVMKLPSTVWGDGADPRRMRLEFGPGPGMAFHGQRFLYSFSRDPEVFVFEVRTSPETGMLVPEMRSILRRTAWQPDPVTPEHVEAFETQYVEGAVGEDGSGNNERLQQLRRNNLERMTFADHFPAHGRMLVDRAGGLWLERYAPRRTDGGWNATRAEPTIWEAYDPDGAWLGPVAFPPDFFPFEIGEDYVLGLWRDEMDVEYVRLYALEKRV